MIFEKDNLGKKILEKNIWTESWQKHGRMFLCKNSKKYVYMLAERTVTQLCSKKKKKKDWSHS